GIVLEASSSSALRNRINYTNIAIQASAAGDVTFADNIITNMTGNPALAIYVTNLQSASISTNTIRGVFATNGRTPAIPGSRGREGTGGRARAQPESRGRCLRARRLGRGTSSRISWADRGATAPRRASAPSGAEGSARTRTDSLPVRRWTATRVRTWSKRSAVAMAGTVRTEPAGRPAEVRVRSQPCGPSGWTEPGHFTITYSRT